MRVAVTGGTGFVGQALRRALHGAGHETLLLLRQQRDLALMSNECAVVCPANNFAEGLAEALAGVQVVVHLATCYGRAGESTSEVLQANVLLPVALVEAAAERGIPCLLGDTFSAKIGVDYAHLALYNESKRAAVALAQAVAGGRIALGQLVFEHIFGPGDGPSKAIPGLIKQLLAGVTTLPLTSGEQRRDFVFVDDVATAICTVIVHSGELPKDRVQSIAIGSGQACSLRAFVERCHQLSGSPSQLQWGVLPQRRGEPESTGADLDWLKQRGWAPRHSLEDGIRLTIQDLAKEDL